MAAPPNILRIGSDGPEVRQLQELLRALGHHIEQVDGTFGPDTERAVRDFQKRHELEDDGIVGQRTSETLGSEADRLMKAPLGEDGDESVIQMKADEDEGKLKETAPNAALKQDVGTGPQRNEVTRSIARVDSDHAEGTDLLDVTPDVNSFASLVASSLLKPPLAIGLFGDWGSGKTFFMRQLQQRIEKLAREASKRREQDKDTVFHTDIIQIEFNAWHYVEANLWASLVTHIFETLNKHFVQQDVEKAKWERLLRKLDEALQLKSEAEAGLVQAHKDLAEARRDQEEKQTSLTEAITAVWNGLKDTDAGPALAKLERTLHVEEIKRLQEGLTLHRSDAGDLYDRAALFRRSAFRGLGSTATLSAVAGVILVCVVLVALVSTGVIEEQLQAAAARIAEVLALVGGVSTWIGSALRSANGTMDAVEQVESKIREQLTSTRPESNNLHAAEQAVAAAGQEVTAQQQHIAELQQELHELRPSQRLAQFLADRASSTDYRKYLGLPALIRRDFHKLEKLMAQDIEFTVSLPEGMQRIELTDLLPAVAEELKKVDTPLPENTDATTPDQPWSLVEVQENDQGWCLVDRENGRTITVTRNATKLECVVRWDLPRIDRIVLYIDDLDRCPPARVVQVLQAVHLMLAFDLFVVVVGVDARWVSQSLKHHYKELWLEPGQEDGSLVKQSASEDAWVVPGYKATPHEYLEKIFQIPFWLQPMSSMGTRGYIQGLLPTDELSTARSRKPAKGDESSGARSWLAAVTKTDESPASVEQRHSVPLMRAIIGEAEEFDDETMNPQNLRLERDERDFMEDLAQIVGRSPRGVKRFVNVYRLIRAGIAPQDYDAFVGSGENPGDYQVVLLLLAIVIGAPTIALSVFGYVDRQPSEQLLSKFIREIGDKKGKAPHFKDSDEWTEIGAFIERYTKGVGNDVTVGKLKDYQRRVGQYSFRVGRF
jgi:hypothetical protein